MGGKEFLDFALPAVIEVLYASLHQKTNTRIQDKSGTGCHCYPGTFRRSILDGYPSCVGGRI